MNRTLALMLAFTFGWILIILWILSPLDVIPDVVPVVGWLDDLLAMGGGVVGSAALLWKMFGVAQEVAPALATDKPAYEPIDARELRSW